jgi:hypothetical protein
VKPHRLSSLLVILTLVFVARTYAEGTYQRTDDRKKTFVWNNDPQPGDIANWSGERDAEGYATGSGTLSWARLDRGFSTGSNVSTTKKRTPISSYTGTMEHGKFTGVVTTVERGKTYHANFVDGQRKGNWAAGAAVAKAEKVETAAAVEKPQRVEAAKSTSVATTSPITEKVVETKKSAAPPVAKQTTEDVPAAGPTEVSQPTEAETKTASSEEKAEVSSQSSETSSSTTAESSRPATPLIAQASTTQADESATPRQQPVTRKAALAPGAVRAIDRPTTATTTAPKKKEATKQPAKTSEEKSTKTAKPAPSQPTEAESQTTEDVPAAGPTMSATDKPPVEKPEKIEPPVLKSEQPKSAPPSANQTPADDSIKTLTGPPAGLRSKTGPLPETNPPTEIPTAPAAAPAPSAATAKLTPVQAMDIADIEARTRGYDLGEYQLPKATYNSANDTWSVAYIGRGADGTEKKLGVVVQDKSGKAEVKK